MLLDTVILARDPVVIPAFNPFPYQRTPLKIACTYACENNSRIGYRETSLLTQRLIYHRHINLVRRLYKFTSVVI